MKYLLPILMMMISFSAFAKGVCTGVQDMRGVRANLTEISRTTYALDYKVGRSSRHCVFKENVEWNDDHPNKSFWVYNLNRSVSTNCGADVVQISKKETAGGRYFVNVNFRCGSGGGCSHGDMGPQESFLCPP